MVPTLSQIQNWDCEHLRAAAWWWDSRAQHWGQIFATMNTQIPAPGGTPWVGLAADAATARAAGDSASVEQAAATLRTAAGIARDGAAQLEAVKSAALRTIDTATADRFVVGEDLSVIDTTNPPGLLAHTLRQRSAEEHAAAIGAAAMQLADTDATVAQALRTATSGLSGVGFRQSPPGTEGDSPHDGSGDPPGPATNPLTPAKQLPLPTQGETPTPTEATRDNSAPDVSKHLADNPNPSPLLAGLSADQWRERLAHFQPGDPLPDPRTPTGDKAIDSLAYAAGQQNTSYAWGGNKSTIGPSRGQADDGEGANQNHDWDRVGYDCGGLVRYSVEQGAGIDVGMGTNNIDKNARLAHLENGGAISPRTLPTVAQPGDILVFEKSRSGHQPFSGTDTEHTGIYIGNGFMMNAPESGEPVGIADASRDSRRVDVLRINNQ